jgi:hypothetical protein
LDSILDLSIGMLARRHGFPGARRDVLAKTALAREPTDAEHVARAHRAVPERYEEGSERAREIAAADRWMHENISARGKLHGVPDGGMAKGGADRAIDTVVSRILDINLPPQDRGEMINAIADEYFLGNTQKVLAWALAEREARDRRRNSFGKAGEPAIGVDRFGNQVRGRADGPSSSDYLHIEDLKRGQRPFAPLWSGMG